MAVCLHSSADTSRDSRRLANTCELLPSSESDTGPGPAAAVGTLNGYASSISGYSVVTGDAVDCQAGQRNSTTRTVRLGKIASIVVLLDEDTITIQRLVQAIHIHVRVETYLVIPERLIPWKVTPSILPLPS